VSLRHVRCACSLHAVDSSEAFPCLVRRTMASWFQPGGAASHAASSGTDGASRGTYETSQIGSCEDSSLGLSPVHLG
jgi:hypothetical protein